MTLHQIRAAHNGILWTIGLGPDDEPVSVDFKMEGSLYMLFECTCGAEFENQDEAANHLRAIETDRTGEGVRHFTLR